MSGLALKVPPVLLVFVVAGLMWFAKTIWPELNFKFPGRTLLSVGVTLIGAAVIVSAYVSFQRVGTTVNPMKPESSSALVRSGIYAWSRNPMYVGFLLILIAWALLLSNATAFVFLPGFLLYMNRFQIEPEERALFSTFGQHFTAYAARVRRWI
ncbi:conserved membrane protein of unknown function [Nitrospira sp. KM1]|uniref:methyltransferase family protein n=1 Tax=Nitrospira sp. KM1 TaxID=1936990 RepID=UPI0013A77BA9|nr:isoprenylcysteine carboxylmethyltransferase family protein [Nitrospira sp. KM1]BCA52955.1 conserved membrane protein of unknown function [Nitrospira sp. KM1]